MQRDPSRPYSEQRIELEAMALPGCAADFVPLGTATEPGNVLAGSHHHNLQE